MFTFMNEVFIVSFMYVLKKRVCYKMILICTLCGGSNVFVGFLHVFSIVCMCFETSFFVLLEIILFKSDILKIFHGQCKQNLTPSKDIHAVYSVSFSETFAVS